MLQCLDLPMIVWQSSPSITVESFRSAVTLYCIASNHGCCSYHWRKLGETTLTFPSSPVIYINGGGLYQCTVKSHGLMDISSRMIRVHCHIGRYMVYKRREMFTYIRNVYMSTATCTANYKSVIMIS